MAKPTDSCCNWNFAIGIPPVGYGASRLTHPTTPVVHLPRDHHGGAHAHATEQVGDVLVVHADAAVGHEPADGARHVGAVNGVFGAGERHGGDTHRILRRPARDHAWQRRLVALDLRRRRPVRPEVFAVDPGGALPLLAGLADADRVADGVL